MVVATGGSCGGKHDAHDPIYGVLAVTCMMAAVCFLYTFETKGYVVNLYVYDSGGGNGRSSHVEEV